MKWSKVRMSDDLFAVICVATGTILFSLTMLALAFIAKVKG